MLKVGQKVFIKESEQIPFPRGGVVTSVNVYSYTVKLSDGSTISVFPPYLKAAEPPSLEHMAEILAMKHVNMYPMDYEKMAEILRNNAVLEKS